eukprot:s352_g38.t1
MAEWESLAFLLCHEINYEGFSKGPFVEIHLEGEDTHNFQNEELVLADWLDFNMVLNTKVYCAPGGDTSGRNTVTFGCSKVQEYC